MIDRTPMEQQAFVSALRPLGEAVTEIGMDKPLSAYTREEVLTLIETVVDAWQKRLIDDNFSARPTTLLNEDTSVEGTSAGEEPF